MTTDLWRRAETELCLGLTGSPLDKVVWEHSARVARMAGAIADLPGIGDRAIDRRALTAAALYHDAGWVVQFRAGEQIPRLAGLVTPLLAVPSESNRQLPR